MNLSFLLPGESAWVFGLAVGIVFALIVLAVYQFSGAVTDPLRRRLRVVGSEDSRDLGAIARFGERLLPRAKEQRDSLSATLMHAGLRKPQMPGLVYSLKLILALLFPVIAFVLVLNVPQLNKGAAAQLLYPAIAAVIGWWLPSYVIRRMAEARQARIMDAFPDALDLLVACTEAGLGLNAAIERVAEQMPASCPEIADEFSLVNSETRAGVDRIVALKNLSTRTGLNEIRGLVSLIVHSVRFGTSIATTLRTYADDFRDRRLQRAEEAAATVGTKLIFPLVLCIFPAFFLVAIGPAIVGAIRVVGASKMGGG